MIIKRGTANVIERDYDDGFDIIAGRNFTVEVLYINGDAGKFAFAWENYSGKLLRGAHVAPMVLDVDVETNAGAMALFNTFAANIDGIESYTWTTPLADVSEEEATVDFPITIAQGGTGATTVAEALVNLGAAAAIHGHVVADVTGLQSALDGKAESNHNHDAAYAAVSHSHSGYALTGDVTALEDAIADKADENHTHTEYAAVSHAHDYATTNHTHTEYAASSHSHSDYATVTALNTLSDEVDGKADSGHVHSQYATTTALEDLEDVVGGKAAANHNHDSAYAGLSHTHNDLATVDALSDLSDVVDGKANASHSHNDVYYTEAEVDTMLAGKANSTHTHNYAATSHSHSVATTSADGFMSASDKVKLNGIAAGAEVNQNAFSNVVVGNVTVAADGKTDTLNLVGSNVTLTGNATDDSITIGITKANVTSALGYTPPTTNTTYEIVSTTSAGLAPKRDGSTTKYLRADGTWATPPDNNTTYEPATQTADGLMSYTDKVKLDSIAAGANNYTLPNAGTTLGGVRSGGDVTISAGVITVNDDSHNHVISNVDGLQDALDDKSGIGHTHTVANITDVTATAAEINKLDGLTATTAELNFVDGVTSNIQDQLNAKAASGHTHSNATASAHGFMSKSDKSKLDGIAAGANAYAHPTSSGNKHIPAGGSSSQILRWSADGTAVWGADNNTTYGNATTSTAGLMSATDKAKLDGIATGANNYTYTLPAAGTALGGVKSGGDVTISSGTITVNDDSHNHVIGNVDGLQSALDGKAAASHTHNYAGSSSAGGAATSANKLATARTISLTGDVTGSTSFDGSGNVSITTTVADDSHNHTIANVDGLQTALNDKSASNHKHYAQEVTTAGTDLNDYTDAGIYTFAQAYAPVNVPAGSNGWLVVMPWNEDGGTIKQLWFRHGTSGTNDHETYVRTKISNVSTWSPWSKYYTTSNPPTAAEVGATPAFTNDTGGVEYSYGSGSGKNVLTEISNMPQGFHTVYAIAGTTGNPETSESYRYFIHKTSTTIGWIYAFGADGSIYSNYLAGANTYKGWKTIHDAKHKPLWSSARYMTAGHTVTPSKKLSQCEHGWMLLWSDYDPDTATVNDTDFCTTIIPNRNWAGSTWNGSSYYCDIPRYSAGTATDSESRVIKVLTVYDNKLVGNDNNSVAPRNDVVLRAVYEI